MIVTIIEKVYSFLWGDMIRIPLPGGSGLGILFYARSNVAYLFGDKGCWQTAYKILALIMLFSGGIAHILLCGYGRCGDWADDLIFNIIFLYPLSGQALNELKEYEAEKKIKKIEIDKFSSYDYNSRYVRTRYRVKVHGDENTAKRGKKNEYLGRKCT